MLWFSLYLIGASYLFLNVIGTILPIRIVMNRINGITGESAEMNLIDNISQFETTETNENSAITQFDLGLLAQ